MNLSSLGIITQDLAMISPNLPLIDLPLHLDGSMRLKTILDLPSWRGGKL